MVKVCCDAGTSGQVTIVTALNESAVNTPDDGLKQFWFERSPTDKEEGWLVVHGSGEGGLVECGGGSQYGDTKW